MTPNTSVSLRRDDIGLRLDAINLAAVRQGHVGMEVAPLIESPRKRGEYTYRDLKDILVPQDTRRTPEGAYNRITRHFGKKSYKVENRGLEGPIDIDQEAEWKEVIDIEDEISEATRHGVLEGHEQDVMDIISAKAANETLAAADKWSNDSADVTGNFMVAKHKFRLQCGAAPNSLLLDVAAVDQLMQNASVLDKAGQSGNRTPEAKSLHNVNGQARLDALAVALGVENIIVADSVKNTAGQPLAASLATMFPITRAVLFRRETAATTRTQQWLRTIHWSEAGSRPGCAFDEYDEPKTRKRVLRHLLDYKVEEVNPECVYVFEGVIDTAIYA